MLRPLGLRALLLSVFGPLFFGVLGFVFAALSLYRHPRSTFAVA